MARSGGNEQATINSKTKDISTMPDNPTPKLDAAYWDNRYRENRMGWDLGKVSKPLKEYIDQLKNKEQRILIPGAGNAYEAEYLFKNGFTNVFVVDISKHALANFKSRVPEFPKDQLLKANFFDLDAQFDLILEQTFFCALKPELRPAYTAKMRELLVENGVLAGVLFMFKLTEKGPPFGGNVTEYRGYFESNFNIDIMEPCYNSEPERQGSEVFFKLIKQAAE